MNRRANLPDGALDLGMTGMADQDQMAAARHVSLALDVDLGDQRARGIEDRQAARLRLVDDRLGDAMGAENRHGAVGNFIQRLDEDRAHALELLDHMAVVDDLVADIDRRAELLEGPLDDLDCPDHPRAEPPRLSHKNAHPDQFLPSASSRSDICNRGLPQAQQRD